MSRVAKWANHPDQEKLWQSRPVKGEIGILYNPETRLFSNARGGGEVAFFHQSMCGAYRGFLDRPIERRGLEPDVPVRQSARDLAAGRDTVLEAARRFLLDSPPPGRGAGPSCWGPSS